MDRWGYGETIKKGLYATMVGWRIDPSLLYQGVWGKTGRAAKICKSSIYS